jgi:hypothetical protein
VPSAREERQWRVARARCAQTNLGAPPLVLKGRDFDFAFFLFILLSHAPLILPHCRPILNSPHSLLNT